MTDLTLVASCGSFSPTCAGGAHPGVFQLSDTGTGAAGTNCAGLTFAIAETNSATGPVRFTRTDGFPIVLGRADIACDLHTCRIQFSISNLKMPTVDSYPTLDEAQTNQAGDLAVRHANGSTGSDRGEDVTTIVAGSTTTTTTTTTAPAPSTTIKPSTTTTTTQPPPTKDRPRKPPRPPKRCRPGAKETAGTRMATQDRRINNRDDLEFDAVTPADLLIGGENRQRASTA